MKKVLLFFSLLMIMCNTQALEKCTQERLNELKEKANKVDFYYEKKTIIDSYNYVEPLEIIVFDLHILNSDESLIFAYKNDSDEILLNEGENVIKNLQSGNSVNVIIYAYTNDECCKKILRSKVTTIPYYNDFYTSDKCKGNYSFKYCNEYIDIAGLTEEKFNKELEIFNASNKVNDSKNSYLYKNYSYVIFIIAGIIVVCLIVLFFIFKGRKKESL